MRPRPLSITLVGWLFILVGGGSLVGGVLRFTGVITGASSAHPESVADLAWVVGSALVAIAGGVLVLRGRGWGRWACAAWMLFHIGLSAIHPRVELAMHVAIFGPLFYLLWRAPASAYFKGAPASSA